jgi:hypothetical protein
MLCQKTWVTKIGLEPTYNNNNNNNNIENKKIELKRKPMHVQFYRKLRRPSANEEKSLAWLCSSGLREKLRV